MQYRELCGLVVGALLTIGPACSAPRDLPQVYVHPGLVGGYRDLGGGRLVAGAYRAELRGKAMWVAPERFDEPIDAAVPCGEEWLFLTGGRLARAPSFLDPASSESLPEAARVERLLGNGRHVVVHTHDGQLFATSCTGPWEKIEPQPDAPTLRLANRDDGRWWVQVGAGQMLTADDPGGAWTPTDGEWPTADDPVATAELPSAIAAALAKADPAASVGTFGSDDSVVPDDVRLERRSGFVWIEYGESEPVKLTGEGPNGSETYRNIRVESDYVAWGPLPADVRLAASHFVAQAPAYDVELVELPPGAIGMGYLPEGQWLVAFGPSADLLWSRRLAEDHWWPLSPPTVGALPSEIAPTVDREAFRCDGERCADTARRIWIDAASRAPMAVRVLPKAPEVVASNEPSVWLACTRDSPEPRHWSAEERRSLGAVSSPMGLVWVEGVPGRWRTRWRGIDVEGRYQAQSAWQATPHPGAWPCSPFRQTRHLVASVCDGDQRVARADGDVLRLASALPDLVTATVGHDGSLGWLAITADGMRTTLLDRDGTVRAEGLVWLARAPETRRPVHPRREEGADWAGVVDGPGGLGLTVVRPFTDPPIRRYTSPDGAGTPIDFPAGVLPVCPPIREGERWPEVSVRASIALERASDAGIPRPPGVGTAFVELRDKQACVRRVTGDRPHRGFRSRTLSLEAKDEELVGLLVSRDLQRALRCVPSRAP